jgi:hypothetical protein
VPVFARAAQGSVWLESCMLQRAKVVDGNHGSGAEVLPG